MQINWICSGGGRSTSRFGCGRNEAFHLYSAGAAADRFEGSDFHGLCLQRRPGEERDGKWDAGGECTAKGASGQGVHRECGSESDGEQSELGFAVCGQRRAEAERGCEPEAWRDASVRGVVPDLLVSDQRGHGKAGEAEATKAHLQSVLDVLAGRRKVDEQLRKEIPGAEGLEEAQPEDLVLLAFSSHGYTDVRGVFHMVLADIGKNQPQDRITEELQKRTLSSDELSGWLREVDAGELVMIVDTCHSEATVAYDGFKPGPMGSRGLGQLAYDKGMRILAASKSGQSAIELGGDIKEGLLSYALVHEGLEEGKAAKDGKITMSGWLAYGAQEVPNLFSSGKAKGPNGEQPTVQNTRDIIYLGPDQAPPSYQQPVLFDFAKSTIDVLLSQ